MKHNNKLLLEQLSDWITRNGNRRSLITLTRAEFSNDHKKLHVYYTVIPESQESPANEFLNRQIHSMRDFIKKHAKLEPTFFTFVLDKGERNREHISDLLAGTTETHGSIPETLHE